MRLAPGELAQRLHLLRLAGPCARLFQRKLALAALSDIASYLGKTQSMSVRVADTIYDDVGPEQAAVLTDPPAFHFEPAFRLRRRQRFRRQARRPVILHIETGEMAPYHLMRLVTLQSFRAGIPCGLHAV